MRQSGTIAKAIVFEIDHRHSACFFSPFLSYRGDDSPWVVRDGEVFFHPLVLIAGSGTGALQTFLPMNVRSFDEKEGIR